MEAASDESVMRAVQEGHTEQLGVLFERYHPRIYALCVRLTRQSDVADDLAQETFLRVLRYRDSFREESKFSTWLYRLASNLCHDHWQRKVRHNVEVDLHLVRDVAATATAERDERHERLEQALAQLPIDRREVLVLTRYHDLAYDDVARVLECSPAAARVRAHRALNELREIYRELEGRPDDLRTGARRNCR